MKEEFGPPLCSKLPSAVPQGDGCIESPWQPGVNRQGMKGVRPTRHTYEGGVPRSDHRIPPKPPLPPAQVRGWNGSISFPLDPRIVALRPLASYVLGGGKESDTTLARSAPTTLRRTVAPASYSSPTTTSGLGTA